jgi:hypothetical protein
MSHPTTWFEADRRRLVLEVEAVRRDYPNFTLLSRDSLLFWEGETADVPLGIEAQSLRFQVVYRVGFPITPIRVHPLNPDIPADMWGHQWHRWSDGSICIGNPNEWDLTYTASDVIAKVVDWYFNFVAYNEGLIAAMPDVGRAMIEPRPLKTAAEADLAEADSEPRS